MALGAVGLKTHIWNNNAKSIALLLAFPFLFLFMLWGFFALTSSLSYQPNAHMSVWVYGWQHGLEGLAHTWHWAFIAAFAWLLIAFFFHQSMIEKSVGAVPVQRRDEPELYNLLENLCISRGLAMPKLCIMDTDALNAFASGINQKTYTITVTRGLLNVLNEDELRAVLAHELTHIQNKDVRLLIISVIFVGIISFLSELTARHLFYSMRMRRVSRNEAKNQAAVMLIAMLILAIGYFFAILIRFALSRRREFLADAGAVELTKDPDAMVSALQKISGHADIESAPDDVKAMFIENASSFLGLFATHPPISQRIQVLREYAGAQKA